ncbi:hypothetical protein [Pseudogulbenkiania sp. MAI-1]|uniref:hypothetical protein n=1 Tax=Pseudogulbenkiania sp. MAI-1 TaxID=990370 RepID=UPI00045E7A9B|nr:hypothetical protein [Pseudogulbenkiania sp. MAI-1]
MLTSRDYLEKALAKLGDISDLKKAELLKVGRSSLSQYRSGERIMDDFACIMVATELGIDPLAVIYAANYERERNVERKSAWEDFRKKLGVMGVAGLLVMGMAGTPPKAEAIVLNKSITSVDSKSILCQITSPDSQALGGPVWHIAS